MHVVMIGAGYVGLVSGACFAEFGWRVSCIDVDMQKIHRLQNGVIPIYEPGLDTLVIKGIQSGCLSFSTDLKTAVAGADVVMIAVGTPSRRGDGHADLSYVYAAAKQIAEAIEGYTVIVTKSTVPVGTCAKVAEIIEQTRPDLKQGVDFDIASNPEFLREGSAIEDFMRPDRIVVGTKNERAQEVITRLYRPLYLIETPIQHTNIESSELIKYAANAFLATKIAFINEVSDLCEHVGADVQHVAKGIGLDGRIGRKFLNVGPGYGGSCFPKDTRALSQTAHEYDSPLSIVDAVISSNEQRKERMARKVLEELPQMDATIAVLGITFKPNTDDMREAPSLTIIPKLVKNGLNVRIFDPLYNTGTPCLMDEFEGVTWCADSYEAAHGAEGILILTEWNEFRGLDLEKIKENMAPKKNKPLMMDFRNIYKISEMSGFHYVSLGRSRSVQA